MENKKNTIEIDDETIATLLKIAMYLGKGTVAWVLLTIIFPGAITWAQALSGYLLYRLLHADAKGAVQ